MVEVELKPRPQFQSQLQFQPKLKPVPKHQLRYNP